MKLETVGAGITKKLAVVVAVPLVVVTLIGPEVALAGTVPKIRMALKEPVALLPLNLTLVRPLKFAPLMVTTVPTGPLVGLKLVMSGRAVTVKLPALVPVPVPVVMVILPVVVPVGTVAVICVAELTVNVALMPLNLTEVAPVKFAPVITTLAPTVALEGVNPTIEGEPWTVKLDRLTAVPVRVATPITPEVAPAGTIAAICVGETTVKMALLPLKVTLVTALKLLPVIVTLVPEGPSVGLKLVMVGGTGGGTLRRAASAITMP